MSEHGKRLAGLIRDKGWRHGVELGVHRAESSWDMLAANPGLALIGVDLWASYGGSRKNKATGDVPRHTHEFMRECFEEACAIEERFQGRFKLLVGDTTEAANLAGNCSVDFVFIDGDHRTAKVKADTEAWLPKLRKGGAILWHDINWPSVTKAIEQLGLEYSQIGANLGMWQRP